MQDASAVADFTRSNDVKQVRTQSEAFVVIATFLPEWELDELGFQLKTSFRKEQGASISSADKEQAAEFDTLLRRLDLLKFRDDAAFFFLAIGSLEE